MAEGLWRRLGKVVADWRGLSFEKRVATFWGPLTVGLILLAGSRVLSSTDTTSAGMPERTTTTDEAATQENPDQATPLPNAPDVVDLEVVDATVQGTYSSLDGAGATESSAQIPVDAVQITVRNASNQVSVVHDVELRILKQGQMRFCREAGGYLPVSASYEVSIPATAEEGTVVPVALSQEIAPQTADRFQITLGPDERSSSAKLYWLEVSLRRNGEPELMIAGTAVVATPHLFDFYVDEANYEIGPSCAIENAQTITAFARLRGARSPSFTTVATRAESVVAGGK